MMVECTGDGVLFIEATANSDLDELGDISFLEDDKRLRSFVCCQQDGVDDIADVPLLQVQVTKFKCGGMVLGVTVSHVIADGKAMVDFMISWSEVARGIPISSLHPFLDRSIFSPRNPLKISFTHHEYETKRRTNQYSIVNKLQNQEKMVYRSFCFEPKKLNQLKKTANKDTDHYSSVRPATSFEVIMGLAWIFQTKAYQVKPNENTKLIVAVDITGKFSPPVPERYFGNAIGCSCAQSIAGELQRKPFSAVVKLVQDSFQAVTEDYVKSAIDSYEVRRAQLDSRNTYWATKWSRLAFYDPDFGWGKADQVAPASLFRNLMVTVAQGKDSENVVLSLSLPKSAMEIFEDLMLDALQ